MWIENNRIVGLWSDQNDTQYVIDLQNDYSPESRFLREDFAYLRSRNGYTFYVDDHYVLLARGTTSEAIE